MTTEIHSPIPPDTGSYGKFPGRNLLAFFLVFFVVGLAVIIKFDSYFTDFYKIAKCDISAYDNGGFMSECDAIGQDPQDGVNPYGYGSIYMGTQANAVKNAQEADVIIFGNSRTGRSFSTDAIDNYFKDKGLTYFILAFEGAGYKSAVMTTQRLGLENKIILINNEIFYANKISGGFADIVSFPEKYRTRFAFFHAAQSLQKWSCSSNIPFLSDYYCHGTAKTGSRSAVNGRTEWTDVRPETAKPIMFTRNSRLAMRGVYGAHADELVNLPAFKKSCPILYLVNAPASSPDLMKSMAEKLGIQSVFTDVPGLMTYDNSHMDRPNSERWAQEFVKDLDVSISNCLKGEGRKDIIAPKMTALDMDGATDFADWTLSDSLTIVPGKMKAPLPAPRADTALKPGSKAQTMRKVLREQPIKAGSELTFRVWMWADEPSAVRLQIVRSCSRDTPMETSALFFSVGPEPKPYEVTAQFTHDHDCALLQLIFTGDDTQTHLWQWRADYAPPPVKAP